MPTSAWRQALLLVLGGIAIVSVSFAPGLGAAQSNPDPSTPNEYSVTQVLLGWANAWQSRDVNAYLASYDTAFKGKYASHATWRKARRQSLRKKRWIRVELDHLDLHLIAPGHALARFVQRYESPGFKSQVRKKLILAWRNDAWYIIDEQVLTDSSK